jgi:NAD-dependent SIR2 family protein deacetylase
MGRDQARGAGAHFAQAQDGCNPQSNTGAGARPTQTPGCWARLLRSPLPLLGACEGGHISGWGELNLKQKGTARPTSFSPSPSILPSSPTLRRVKPDIVFFGEALPPRFFECAASDFSRCHLLIVMGTS